MNLIQISNDGPEILSTNYWETEHAKKGFLYMSINAGAFRLLPQSSVPKKTT
ncbi:MAG: hypothetical protein RBT11_19320 [Desulfobacterales bacterium]|jgi:hypothetical protein|nr:hypothetical protein [Desulfobacterales bacterium]